MLRPQDGIQVDKFYPPYDWQYNTMPLTKVGSPTITGGVVSGFTTSDYLQSSNTYDFSQSFEVVFKLKITTSNKVSTFFRLSGSPSYFIVMINSYNRLALYSNDNNGTSIANGTNGTTIFSSNVDYYIKIKFDNSSYKIFSSTDKENWTQEIIISTTQKLGQSSMIYIGANTSSNQYFYGSIDINNSYIVLDGTRYQFSITGEYNDTVRTLKCVAATGNNLTIVGSPTIDENGVASGFSSGNYFNLSSTITSFENIEAFVTFTTSNIDTQQWILSQNNYWGFTILSNGKIRGLLQKSSGEVLINLDTILSANTKYSFKWKVKDNIFYCELYSGSGVLIEAKSNEISGSIPNSNFRFGQRINNNAYVFNGSIDFENTYIKVGYNYLMKGYLTDTDKNIALNKGWALTLS